MGRLSKLSLILSMRLYPSRSFQLPRHILQSVLILLPFQIWKPRAQPAERLRYLKHREQSLPTYQPRWRSAARAGDASSSTYCHDRLNQVVDLRCLPDGKPAFPLDDRLAVGAIDTDILGRFIEAQPKFLHTDRAALLADKNQVASPLDIGPDDDDLPEQVSGSVCDPPSSVIQPTDPAALRSAGRSAPPSCHTGGFLLSASAILRAVLSPLPERRRYLAAHLLSAPAPFGPDSARRCPPSRTPSRGAACAASKAYRRPDGRYPAGSAAARFAAKPPAWKQTHIGGKMQDP